jgi:SAM-dependent methyltransferase
VSLEDYVTRPPEEPNSLGARHAAARDKLVLGLLREATIGAGAPVRVLDVGCSYGHHLLRLNAILGKSSEVEMVGVDLYETSIAYATAFTARIPGFENCSFSVADLASGLPFEEGAFSAINLADVLEHMEDPAGALRELARVSRDGGVLVISTPLRDSLFKRVAARVNKMSRGRLDRSYYLGKGAALDEHGRPVMDVHAGHDHVSEMTLPELTRVAEEAGWRVEEVHPMSVLSGSSWFDRHPPMLAGLLLLEALHSRLRRPSWAHSAVLLLRKAGPREGVAGQAP